MVTENNYRSWKDGVPYVNGELFSHVRSFRYFTRWNRAVSDWDLLPISDLFNYLPLFRHLQHLSLCTMRIGSDISEQLEIFSVFRYTLSSLTFHNLIIAWPTFVSILDYFPNVRDLKITDPSWTYDRQQAPPLSRPLRGSLSVKLYEYGALPTFAECFPGLEVEYDELLILDPIPFPSASYYQRLIDTCRKSLKHLRTGVYDCTLWCFKITLWAQLIQLFYFPGDDRLTLSRCRTLCRLEIFMATPGGTEWSVISSITSINLRTIVLQLRDGGFNSYTLADQQHYWDHLDDIMRRLVDKLYALGYKHTLELEFLFESARFYPDLGFGALLPKFREKGRVRALNISSGEVLDLPGEFIL